MKTSQIDTHENPVILLHGLGRSRFSMSYLGSHLRRNGYPVFNFGYPSLFRSIDQHSERLRDFLLRHSLQERRLSFVTHSLGSIVLRKFALTWGKDMNLHRAVMLGPPNQGAQIARRISKIPTLQYLLGPSFRELRNLRLEPGTSQLEVGIVSGGTGGKVGMLPLVSGDNDGIVRVEETTLEGSRDQILVRGMHSFLMYKPQIIQQVLHFLAQGNFKKN